MQRLRPVRGGLPECPTGAISITEREAADYDKAAVEARMKEKIREQGTPVPHVCPGSMEVWR